MELSRLLRMMRRRWTVIAIVACVGALAALLGTSWFNRRIEPVFQASAAVTHLSPSNARSADTELSALLSLALLANADILASEEGASITSDDETNQIQFTARAASKADAQATAEAMREAFNRSDPRNEEPLIEARLDEIVAELERIEARTITTPSIPPPATQAVILTAQIEALRSRLGSLAAELAVIPPTPETEAQRIAVQAEMELVGNQIGALEIELAAIPEPVEVDTEAELEQTALAAYSSNLVGEYQTLYLRLLGVNPTTREGSVSVVDQTPSPKSIEWMALLGAAAGALLGVGLLVFVDSVRRRIWTRGDFEPIVPALLELPARRSSKIAAPPWYEHTRPGKRKRGIQILRSQVHAALSHEQAAVGILDLGAGFDQVSLLTFDLGASLAASGKSVLVVETHLQPPGKSGDLGTSTYRLADVLSNGVSDDEELRSLAKRAVADLPEVVSGLRILPSGSMSGDRVDPLAGRQMAVLLEEARAAYDVVLVATPSESDPASLAVAQQLDLLVLVTRAGATSVSRLQRAERDLRALNRRLLGGALLVGRSTRRSRKTHEPRQRRPRPRGGPTARHLPEGSGRSRTPTGRQGSRASADKPVRRKVLRVILRKTAKALFAFTDVFRLRFPGPRILIYHQVGSGTGSEIEVSPKNFRRQLEWLQSHGQIVSLEEALERVLEPKSHRIFVISFDDGYSDVYEHAFPQLAERNIPFTFYLTTHPVETGKPLNPESGALPLTWEQLEEMQRSGLMTLGSHTHRHPDLRFGSSLAIEQELDTSRLLIEERLHQTPRHFAYPWGYWSEVAEPLVKERFATAVLGGGRPVVGTTDLHRIHRIPIQYSDGMFFFRRKVKRGMRLEESLRRRLRGYRGAPVAT